MPTAGRPGPFGCCLRGALPPQERRQLRASVAVLCLGVMGKRLAGPPNASRALADVCVRSAGAALPRLNSPPA